MSVGSNYMRVLLLICCFFQFSASSQVRLDFGEVVGKDISMCNSQDTAAICNSKSQLEITLTKASLLMGMYETVTISYDGLKWHSSKLEGNWIHNSQVRYSVVPILPFDTVFAILKERSIFTLPNQDELRYEGSVSDGAEYVLSFKAGAKYRTYSFENPSIYLRFNKHLKAFKDYEAIVKTIFEQFKKE
jgi:hypothetical protein